MRGWLAHGRKAVNLVIHIVPVIPIRDFSPLLGRPGAALGALEGREGETPWDGLGAALGPCGAALGQPWGGPGPSAAADRRRTPLPPHTPSPTPTCSPSFTPITGGGLLCMQ